MNTRTPLSILLFAIALLTGTPLAAALPAKLGETPVPSLAPLVKEVSPAVVNIATRGTVEAPRNPLMDDPFFRRFFGVPEQHQRREVRSAGSGVIVDAKNGYIITNHHVIENADEIEVTLIDDRNLEAEIVGSDPGTDIAVLKLKNPERLKAMRLGDSDKVEVGDFVVAIGNPFGLQHTVTSGIVSAKGRRGINRDGYEDFIQTDASINPGNSGGALVNLRGELIGINSAIFSNSGGNIGIGFAIPVNIAKAIMAQLIEFGEVKRGLLGVSITDVNAETAKALGLDEDTKGALVQEVVPDSAAEKAGIEVGDIIVSVDDKPIGSANDLRTSIGLHRSGDEVRVGLMRDGKRRNVKATLTELGSLGQAAAEDIHPGLAGADLADYPDEVPGLGRGAVSVETVAPGSPAELRGLKQGDLIVSVNRVRVRSVEEMREIAEGRKLLLLGIRRSGRNLLLQVR
ncbi:MAG: DegQ family serine endoprotease [Gammaproteobacteria bacterium]|nr:MAG: DegQ family serine endoprotease [Gammaproteobacteria bacterium]